jgi:hypothetical protein
MSDDVKAQQITAGRDRLKAKFGNVSAPLFKDSRKYGVPYWLATPAVSFWLCF